MLFIRVHCLTIRHTWGLKHEETTGIKQGSNTYYMWRWLRLHVAQPIISSYSLPMSMLFPRGINRNRVSTFRKKILIKDGMCGAENNISLCIAYKVITIVLIPNKYHQFRIWHKFMCVNFIEKKYICSTAKNIEVQCFRFIVLGLLPKKISWDVFYLKYLTDVWLYT